MDQLFHFWIFIRPAVKQIWTMCSNSMPHVNLFLYFFQTVFASSQIHQNEIIICIIYTIQIGIWIKTNSTIYIERLPEI